MASTTAVRAAAAASEGAGPPVEGGDPLAVFREYRRTGERALHQALVCRYAGLPARIARRYVRPGTSYEDLVQIGTIGLIHAVSTFDPARGVKFETYAFHHIAGEIRHFLRDGLESLRAPRWVRRLYSQVVAATGTLQQELGRTPTLAEVAARMRVRESDVVEILRAHGQTRVHSMTDLAEEHDARPDLIVHEQETAHALPVEDRLVLLEALEHLAELQKQVVYYLFYQDLTQNEVAQRLGVSQRHVSRLLAAALRHLAEPLRKAGFGRSTAAS